MVRPKKPADDVRSQVLQLRLTAGERAALEAGAKTDGVTLTEFIRDAALDSAKKVAGKAGKGTPPRKP